MTFGLKRSIIKLLTMEVSAMIQHFAVGFVDMAGDPVIIVLGVGVAVLMAVAINRRIVRCVEIARDFVRSIGALRGI